MSDDLDWPSNDLPWRPRQDDSGYHRPARRHKPIPEGQDFDTMVAKHGRPIGPFEQGREFSYRGNPDIEGDSR